MNTRTKFGRLLAILASLAVLPACWTYSLHPLYEENDPHLIYEPALEGKWQAAGDDCAGCFLVITGDSKSLMYTLQFHDSTEKKRDCGTEDAPDISFVGRVVQLGANRFLDAFPRGDTAGLGTVAAHNFFKVGVNRDSMALVPASDSWLCGDGKPDIGECIDGDFVFTSPTQALQDFIQKHGGDEDLFAKPGADDEWHRIGKPGDSK
jgi:hypothetical protein